ncbi:MAG: hypothetical protein KJ950_06920, partial [Proteobacteria bacterium]|nr:hypothetical protein [Pseudomonadota bacterium]
MKKRLLLITGMVLMMALVGCGSKDVSIPEESGLEKLIWSSAPERPGWTMEEPGTEDGVLSFVGMSGRFVTEKQAKNDAQRDARENVVKYMGTLVKNKFENARVSFGLESSVVDASAGAREFQKQLSVNMASQVKMKNYYMEKWQTETGIGYQAFVLANVPQNAIDETYSSTAAGMQKKAEQRAKSAADQMAKEQAEKAADFWKQMQ